MKLQVVREVQTRVHHHWPRREGTPHCCGEFTMALKYSAIMFSNQVDKPALVIAGSSTPMKFCPYCAEPFEFEVVMGSTGGS